MAAHAPAAVPARTSSQALQAPVAARPQVTTPERDACGIGFVADAHGRESRGVIDAAIAGLRGVRHRGAVSADARTGDGAGLLIPLPRRLLAEEVGASDDVAGDDGERLGAAMCFLDADDEGARTAAEEAVTDALAASGLHFVGWRKVPTDPSALGDLARAAMPAIAQAVFAVPDGVDGDAAERRAYLARRRAEAGCREQGVRAYFASWSTRTITYKAMSAADQLAAFYPDLTDPRTVGWFAVFHQRYSTNTLPTWERAQPFRHLCHNGEINTIQGNENLMRARTGRLGATAASGADTGVEVGDLGAPWPELDGDVDGETLLEPLIDADASDSAKLDATFELLVRGGRTPDHAMAMLVPQVWEGRRDLAPGVRDFYRYHAALAEPWDGPAGLVYTDGLRVAASLDRNGLRPLRYAVCEDGLVVASSEVGAVRTRGHGQVRRERLGPGEMLVVDPTAGGVVEDPEVKQRLARRRPYGRWLQTHQRPVERGRPVEGADEDELLARQVTAGFTKEEQTSMLRPIANDAKEPVSSMGDDTPLAVLSEHRRTVYHYVKHRFAQVTNPPIDHLREWQVMSLRTQLGPREPILTERPEAARLLELDGFLLTPQGLQELLIDAELPLETAGLDATFPVADEAAGLAARLASLGEEAVERVRAGAALLAVSDRGVDAERAPVPALLAVGAVHHRLVAAGLRTQASIVCETDDARETHVFAALLGYGADAVVPRLALETIAALADSGRLGRDSASAGEAQEAFLHGIADGVLKIMSKMGISTLDSYRSAQVFEAIGLGHDVIDAALRGTPSELGGVGLADLADDVLARHEAAFRTQPKLESPGFYKARKGGEYHVNNPETIGALHRSLGLEGEHEPLGAQRTGDPVADQQAGSLTGAGQAADLTAAHVLARATTEGRGDLYDEFAQLVNHRPATAPRDLLAWVPAAQRGGDPVPLEEVEPARAICQRFFTGAMSLGALSPESHEDLAIAMNMIGGSSNTGEGGEDARRYRTRGGPRDANSKGKQVASGRFGVTPQYLAYADELQIKMAQGSKPGEGGHLPGHKVDDLIARLRHTQPGVPLISPPPHHDIYSIEDLAQLIYDLKQVNPVASVSVKLVASDGVGVVAAGVVKGLADAVQIAGADGGTGASPLSSIKHAGLPWELGLADAHRTLVANGLRGRTRLQVDGGMRTGRDVLTAALLGADEYGFGTIALIAQGCVMARACHRNTCPVGIATQRTDLRAKYAGTPEMVAAYLTFVAEEVRRGLSELGLRSLDEAIGRPDLLRRRDDVADPLGRGAQLDLAPLLNVPAPEVPGASPARHYEGALPLQAPRSELGDQVFDDAFPALFEGGMQQLKYEIRNADRTVGARLGGAVGLEFGDPDDRPPKPTGQVSVRFAGEAGQSFGAFLTPGAEFTLTGEANDYVGKGLGGGRIVVRPPEDDAGDPVLVGNTVLYGATSGELFVAGRAGERFAVRNSGADAVVEGTGDHTCEYMTGGTVVVLGRTGFNVGAGMTGGELYVLDESQETLARVNAQLVDARRVEEAELGRVRELVARHTELTGSPRGQELLDHWDERAGLLWRIAPRGEMAKVETHSEAAAGAPV